MKELSVEEKAKRFDEAINKIMDYRNGKTKMYTDVNKAIDYLFPELAESEDEKIRKAIITYLSTIDDKDLVPWESWIAWLEKQGEQKHVVTPKFKVGDTIRELETGNLFYVNSIEDFGYTLHYKNCNANGCTMSFKYEDNYELVEQKTEWSEEDCNQIETIACHLDNIGNGAMAESLLNIMDKYKSLRPQSTWKPSEEMLEALYRAIPENVMEISEDEMLLDKLYQGLKYGRVLGKN